MIEGNSQVKFIQITDPHIYDDESPPENIEDNKQALLATIKEINRQVERGKTYDFVVITGDLGIEKAIGTKSSIPEKFDESKISENLKNQAVDLSKVIGLSNVPRWLFVVGNNDIFDERPETIGYFDDFVKRLQAELPNKEITNLTPPEGPTKIPVNGLSFIGFNDASFKNQNKVNRLGCDNTQPELSTYDTQLKEVSAVSKMTDALKTEKVFIFYHIPELDDRYLIDAPDQKARDVMGIKNDDKTKTCIGKGNIYSPWFVKDDIRQIWNKVVEKENVKGLFAGHFHDYRRETYLQIHWLRSVPFAGLSKLYVCPPLAMKVQNRKLETARGFQEVSINKEGGVLDAEGGNGVRIFWYDNSTKTFTSDYDDAKEGEALSQLKLGELYENNRRLADAEGAYNKALASDNSIIQQSAREGLDRVVEKQASPWSKYIFSRQTVSQESVIFFLSLIGALLMGIWYSCDWVSYKRRRVVLSPFTVAILLIFGFILIWILLQLIGDYFLTTPGRFLPGWALISALSLIVIGLWALSRITHQRGRDKLLIDQITDVTEHKVAMTFPPIFSVVRGDMISVRTFEGPFRFRLAALTVPEYSPVMVDFYNVELTELVEESIGGPYGKLLSWFLRKITRPEYVLKCIFQPSGQHLAISTILERRGVILRSWQITCLPRKLLDSEKQLAHDILTYIDDLMV